MMFVAAFLVAAVLPAWASLVIVVPTLMALSVTGAILPLGSAGQTDLQAYDVVTLVAAFKLGSAVLLRGGTLVVHRLHAVLLLFLGVLTAATLLAAFDFGFDFFRQEVTPLLRFATPAVAVVLLLPQGLGERQLPLLRRSLGVLGYVLAVPIFMGQYLLGSGIFFGEVHGERTFGFIGDQVGFVLVLYVFWHLLARNYFRALFFALAILTTGTRGALLAIVAGLLVLAVRQGQLGSRRVRWMTVLGLPLVLVVVLVTTDLGGTRTRLTGSAVGRGSNVQQRLITQQIGVEVVAESPLVGVGYSGYRQRALEHRAKERFLSEMGFYAKVWTANAGNQLLQTATDAGVFGVAALGVLFWGLLRAFAAAATVADPATGDLLTGAYLWLWAIILGNQAAVWLVPGSFIGYVLWTCAAVAIAASRAAPRAPAPPAAPAAAELAPAGAG